ncbi:hypothetical protein ABIC60_004509 [Phyllobacterium ifriqiyense]
MPAIPNEVSAYFSEAELYRPLTEFGISLKLRPSDTRSHHSPFLCRSESGTLRWEIDNHAKLAAGQS